MNIEFTEKLKSDENLIAGEDVRLRAVAKQGMKAMDGKETARKSRRGAWVWALVGLAGLLGLAAICAWVALPFMLQISDQAGPFYITFSPADMDGDGDTDVLVHNMRKPGRFEACSGGTLWTNQGGAQGGEAGIFTYRRNDIEGGWASTLADLDGDGDPDVLIYDGSRIILGINQGGKQGGARQASSSLRLTFHSTDLGPRAVRRVADGGYRQRWASRCAAVGQGAFVRLG